MSQGGIDPEKVTKPIQLVAAWFAALVLLVGLFLGASGQVQEPSWLPVVYAFAAVCTVPLFASLVFRLQTRYRAELQEDPYYAKFRSEREQQEGFKAENLPGAGGDQSGGEIEHPGDLGQRWMRIVEKQRGLFVVHTWRPSTQSGQVADITIRLHEHGPEWTPISNGDVERVEYYLGSSFFGGKAVSKTNANDGFRLDVSAWGSTVCVARVHFRNEDPVEIYRYLDFAVAS